MRRGNAALLVCQLSRRLLVCQLSRSMLSLPNIIWTSSTAHQQSSSCLCLLRQGPHPAKPRAGPLKCPLEVPAQPPATVPIPLSCPPWPSPNALDHSSSSTLWVFLAMTIFSDAKGRPTKSAL